jgi:hypothetical protein
MVQKRFTLPEFLGRMLERAQTVAVVLPGRALRDHLAHELVSEDAAALHRRHQAIHQMKV